MKQQNNYKLLMNESSSPYTQQIKGEGIAPRTSEKNDIVKIRKKNKNQIINRKESKNTGNHGIHKSKIQGFYNQRR